MMDKTTGALCTLAFSVGAITGAYVIYKKLDMRYQKRLDDELDEAREARREFFRRKNTVKAEAKEVEDDIPAKPNKDEAKTGLKEKITELKYGTPQDGPYVISPEEFGEFDDYETITLTYFVDGVLTDEDSQPIDDPEDTVGVGYEDHFGEYEDDSVYIRNDERKCDYEILRVLDTYSALLKEKPYLRNSE